MSLHSTDETLKFSIITDTCLTPSRRRQFFASSERQGLHSHECFSFGVMTPKLFRYVDFIPLSHGVPCSEMKSKTKRRSTYFIKISVHFYFIQQMSGIIYDAISKNDFKIVIESTTYFSCYLCFIAVSTNLQASVTSVIYFAERFLSNTTKKIEITEIVDCWVTYYATLSLFYRTADLLYPTLNETGVFDENHSWIPTPNNLPLALISKIIQAVVHGYIADLVGYVFIYCYLAFVISTIKNAFLDYLFKLREMPIKEFEITWYEIVALRRHFDDNLSTIPFLALTVIFVNLTYIVCNYVRPTQVHQTPFNATTMNETLAKAIESAQMNEHIRSLVLWLFQLRLTAPIIAIPFFISRIQKTLDHHFDTIV